jgi:hypothetical protein
MLTYGSETCKHDESRIMAVEIKFIRRMAGYTYLDYKRNSSITKELNPVMEFTGNYRCNWKNHVLQMLCTSIPFQ